MFCRETVEELRNASSEMAFPPILFVFPADREAGDAFFAGFWPEARAVSDPEGTLYSAFDVSRASLRQILGPGVWVSAIQAWRKSGRPRGVIGDPWLLPGLFLVQKGRILWRWKFRNIGDHPEFREIPKLIGR